MTPDYYVEQFAAREINMQIIKDDQITRTVYNKLAARGFGSLGHLSVQTNDGLVTLVGTVRYAHQKTAALTAISGIAGIRRVIDQLTVRPATKHG